MNVSKNLFAANYFLLLLLSGCGGQLYKVAPLPADAPPAISSNKTNGITNGLNVGAVALDGDQSLEKFEANLPLAGLIVIDTRLVNRFSETIDLNKLRFELRDSSDAKFKLISPKKALKRVMNHYGDSFYRLDARRLTEERYQAVALNLKDSIAPQEERRGYLFFETNRGSINISGLSLSIKGADRPIVLQLDIK